MAEACQAEAKCGSYIAAAAAAVAGLSQSASGQGFKPGLWFQVIAASEFKLVN